MGEKKIEELDINYHVTGEFVNGKQALEYCREHEVEVVFTDSVWNFWTG